MGVCMTIESDNTVDLPLVGQRQVCPACGGPMVRREETIIRLGQTDEVRHRQRYVDPWCGRSLQLPDTTLR